MDDELRINDLTQAIIGAAIDVHRELGPGLLESVYRKCLAYELRKRGHEVAQEQPIPVCLLYTSPSPRDLSTSRMPSSA